VVGIQGHML